MLHLLILPFILIGALINFIRTSISIVPGQYAYVLERLGTPLKSIWYSGIHIKLPSPITKIREKIDLRQQQIEKSSNCKTSDNVFIDISWVVRYTVNDPFSFVYSNENPIENLLWQVENDLRQIISSKKLDELYSGTSSVGQGVETDMKRIAHSMGISLDSVLVEQPRPPTSIVNAMNEIQASESIRNAAFNKAEAKRIELIGIAQAEKESKKLQGEGIAAERAAIAEGLKENIEKMSSGENSLTREQAFQLLMKTIDAGAIQNAAQMGRGTMMVVPYDYSNNPAALTPLAAVMQQQHPTDKS